MSGKSRNTSKTTGMSRISLNAPKVTRYEWHSISKQAKPKKTCFYTKNRYEKEGFH